MGETELIISFMRMLATQYPFIGDIIFCLGVLWIVLIVVLNIIDGLIYVFQLDKDGKWVGIFRRFCERFGPSLSLFARESHNKLKNKNNKP